MLIGKVKRPIWIQTNIYRVRSIAAFELLFTRIFKFLLLVTVALDQRKQKYTEFLKFLF